MRRVTYTSPEVAAVGRPAGSAGTTVRTLHHDEVDRAIVEGRTAGFTRLVLDRRGRVVGATVVGPRAGETLAELTSAVRRGLRARDLAGVMHPYPTWGDGPWNAPSPRCASSWRPLLSGVPLEGWPPSAGAGWTCAGDPADPHRRAR
ncbi:hypothetical protein [Pseudonocardia nigra]|uniref:hypothetical protein n=1 Tax=Pseudonocardia nigra TaxID=1921578 RepID=UPI001C5EE7AD|nr:hypothetical protein [Pseudonocardia nigra]